MASRKQHKNRDFTLFLVSVVFYKYVFQFGPFESNPDRVFGTLLHFWTIPAHSSPLRTLNRIAREGFASSVRDFQLSPQEIPVAAATLLRATAAPPWPPIRYIGGRFELSNNKSWHPTSGCPFCARCRPLRPTVRGKMKKVNRIAAVCLASSIASRTSGFPPCANNCTLLFLAPSPRGNLQSGMLCF